MVIVKRQRVFDNCTPCYLKFNAVIIVTVNEVIRDVQTLVGMRLGPAMTQTKMGKHHRILT